MDTPSKIGRYEILGELGRGAMGTVYRAQDPAMGRVVALKTIISVALASEQGNEFRERFYREARAAGALAHPGIVAVFDVGEYEGVPFLVMEFITGRTLDDVIKKGERLSLERTCEIGQQIAQALGYAHQRGVVHRDIKPANILLTSREAHGIERPKITDFGVAKLMEGQATSTGQMLGTPAFMPPEQFSGGQIDGRSDLYSLGVVLYEMATGELPFPGESLTTVSYKVMQTEPVPPRKLNPALPAKLEGVILKCLAKDPAERYQTGEELARDLGELRGEGKVAGMRSPAPQTAAAGAMDPDATFIEARTPGAARTTVPTPVVPTPVVPPPVIQPPAIATPVIPAPVISQPVVPTPGVITPPTPTPVLPKPDFTMPVPRAPVGLPALPKREPARWVAPPPKRKTMSAWVWVILVIVAVAGWYVVQGRHQPAVKKFINRILPGEKRKGGSH
jgi:predicted Ser/Thr protein kinase